MEFCFFFKVLGEGQTSSFERLHPFFLSVCSLHLLKRIVRVSFPCMRGAFFFFDILEGSVRLFENELSSVALDWRKLSVSSCRGRGRGLFCLEARGTLSFLAGGSLPLPNVKELSSRKKLSYAECSSSGRALKLGLETLWRYKRKTRNALPVAGLGKCFFGVQTLYAECSFSGWTLKLLFWSINSVCGITSPSAKLGIRR